MKPPATFRLLITNLFVMLSCLSSMQEALAGEHNAFLHVVYDDTLLADNETPILRNNISFTNIFSHRIGFDITIILPQGYSLVSRNNVFTELGVGESFILPLAIIKSKTVLAGRQPVLIKIALKNPATTLTYQFDVVCRVSADLRILPLQKEFRVSKEKRSITLGLRIKNVGNADNHFYVQYFSKHLQIDKKIKVQLRPFRDTVMYYPYTLPGYLVNQIGTEVISVKVGNDTNYVTQSFTISRLKSVNQQHHNPFNTFPFSIETGLLYSTSETSYYFAFNGAVEFDDRNFMSFYYKSKQYGTLGIQNDIFSVFYRHRKWDITLGQMTESRHFMVNGIGAQVNYRKNDIEGLSLTAVSSMTNRDYYKKDKELVVSGCYRIGKLLWSGLGLANFDQTNKVNSYITQHKLDIIRNEKMLFNVSLGAGTELYNGLPEGRKKMLWGTSYGYDFAYEWRKWGFLSNVLINSNNFPGIFRGWRSINHSALYNFNRHFSAALFYNANYTRQSYFIDSIYYDNRFLYNLTSYGVRLGYTERLLNISVNIGHSRSTGAMATNLPSYKSGGLNMALQLGRYSRVSLNTTVSLDDNATTDDNRPVVYYANNVTLSTRMGGLNFYYNRMPSSSGSPDGMNWDGYRKVISFSPYINISLLRRKISGRLQYSFYKVSEKGRDNEFQFLLGNLNYANIRQGLDLQVQGSYAIKSSFVLSNYVSVSIRKSFNVPIITARKFFDLDLSLFHDANGNGIRDNAELPVKDVLTSINGYMFQSDNAGRLKYRNMEKGTYTVDFHNMTNEDGLIPAQGFIQSVTLNGNTAVNIPFGQGRRIKGVIMLTLDSISQNKFSVSQLRVTAVDSMGNKFSTFTDDEGRFQLSLPASNYVVSLNPDAYDENFKPVQMAFPVDLLYNNEAKVTFHIKQKNRKVNRVKSDIR
jgi:hypothetical protein